MRRELVVIFLLLLISYPAVKALLQHGGYTSHDLTHHVVRQIDMDRLLSEGQFPPRWSGQLNNGYGYPTFLFNYPLPALVGEVFHKAGFNFLYSVKSVLFLSMILSILGMYLFLRSYLDSKLAAFLGAVFYLYAPHRFLNVYVAAALGSALGGAILPFVFWSLVMIKKTDKSIWVFMGSLFFALLVTAHNITILIFSIPILAFASLLVWESKKKRKLFEKYLLMFLLGIGLSAWFWLPAVWEKQYIRFDQIFGSFYENQFPNPQQLIRSAWGYGLSHPEKPEPGDMAYQIGMIHLLAVVFLILGVIALKKIRIVGTYAITFFSLSILLILKISQPLWQYLPLLYLVQFPLRFSSLSVFTASLAAALLVKYFPYSKIIFIFLFILVIYANRNHWNINQVIDPGEEYYLEKKTTTATFDEHLPKWGRRMEAQPVSKLEFIEGQGKLEILQEKSAQILAHVEASASSKIRLNQFYFPGWTIKIDGKKTRFNYLTDGESYGMPSFDIDKGKHIVLAEFKNTTNRNIADTVSMLTFLGWIGVLMIYFYTDIRRVK